jgi:hypothetical protein
VLRVPVNFDDEQAMRAPLVLSPSLILCEVAVKLPPG